jgi:hypothetical protein
MGRGRDLWYSTASMGRRIKVQEQKLSLVRRDQ